MSDIPPAVWENAKKKLGEVRNLFDTSAFPPCVNATLDILDLMIQINESD